MKVEVVELFSIPLFHFKINPPNQEEIKTFILKTHEKYSNCDHLNQNVMGNNTNYSKTLLKKPIFKSVIEEIENKVTDIFSNFYCYTEITPFICDLWSTCVKKKEIGPSMHFHTHSNSLLSGVWYPFDNNSPIMFRNESKDFFTLNQNLEKILGENKKYMSNEYSTTKILPQQNTVILFSSKMPHAVSYHENITPRYSVAFNIFFKGNLMADTAHLNIDTL
jgi:uncharacterized protein (TIGR02466 family)